MYKIGATMPVPDNTGNLGNQGKSAPFPCHFVKNAVLMAPCEYSSAVILPFLMTCSPENIQKLDGVVLVAAGWSLSIGFGIAYAI